MADDDDPLDPRLSRDPVISQPRHSAVEGLLGGSIFPVHIVLGGGAQGASILVEQRSFQLFLQLGDLVKRRRKEALDGVLSSILDSWALSPQHVSIPKVHKGDSMKVICQSLAHVLAWLFEIHGRYSAARGAHGSARKVRHIFGCIEDLFAVASRICGSLPAAPQLSIGGVDIPISPRFELSMAPVVAAFPSMPREWAFLRSRPGLQPRVDFSDSRPIPAADVAVSGKPTSFGGRQERRSSAGISERDLFHGGHVG